MTADEKLEQLEKRLKDDRDAEEALELEIDEADRKVNPPPVKPDHPNRDGGVF